MYFAAQTVIMPHLSDEQKWSIIQSLKRGASMSAVARQHGVTRMSVQLWAKRYNATSKVQKQKATGRRASMSAAAASKAVELLCANAHAGAGAVAKELHSQGLTSKVLHRTTVVRHAKQTAKAAGTPIRVVRGKPAKRLSNATKAKRVAFCKVNRSRQWSSVLFSDRKKFQFYYPGVSVQAQQWVKKGQAAEASAVNHAQTANVYCGISKFGVTDCHIVAGTSKHKSTFFNKHDQPSKNITSQEYRNVLNTTLLPGGTKIFTTQGVGSWVLQQDNDPAHKVAAAVVEQWNTHHSCSVTILPKWPPNSPDLNLIENFWAYAQAKVDAQGCKTFEEFKQAVLFEMKHIPKHMLTKLYKSMPKRVAQVIALAGDKTKY
jgi:transposase-like protein